MQKTPKLQLNKPDLNDYVNVSDLNENMDILDGAVSELQEGTAVIPDLETTNKTLAGGINENKQNLAAHLAERASLSEVGHVQLSNATDSESEILAATPKAIKAAMDRADAAFTSASNGKTTVKNAITGVDPTVVIPNEPTYNDLATAIGQISTGKKWASGHVDSPAIRLGGELIDSLSFSPSFVIVNTRYKSTSASGEGNFVYSASVSNESLGFFSQLNIPTSAPRVEEYNFMPNGFLITAPYTTNQVYYELFWIAFE